MPESNPDSEQPIKPRWTAETANHMITRWKKSGLSQAAFCRREEIALYTFNYWMRKTGRSSRKSRNQKKQNFLEIKNPRGRITSHDSPIELVTPSGYQLNLSSGFSSDDLHRILSALKTEAC